MKRSLSSRIREYFDTNRKNVYEIKPYLLKDGKSHPVAIVCPGGGYRRVCSFVEGHPYAKKLNAMGCHAVVVYYRVNVLARYPAPQDDLARAVRVVHAHAEEWNLDMNGYSVWGSSAGGHLAASFGTENMGYVHYDLPKPGALILTFGRREEPYGERAVVSYDNGESWTDEYILNDSGKTIDLGYAATTELNDGSLLTVYYQAYGEDDFPSFLCTRWNLKKE